MSTREDICNMALSHLGQSKRIDDLDNDFGKAPDQCRTFFVPTRDELVRDFHWQFATAFVSLAGQIEEPTDEWAYSYTYPADCLRFRRILNTVSRVERNTTRVPWRIARIGGAKVILTDMDDAVGEYTMQITDVTLLQPDLVSAFALLLAAKIGPALTGGDPAKMVEKCFVMYQNFLNKARLNDQLERSPDNPPESEYISSRD
jgi:hypothetical protein